MSRRAARSRHGTHVLRTAGVAVVAVALTACGFHLRGSYRLADALFPLHVEAPGGSAIARELRDRLRRQGLALVDDPEGAAARLVILDERSERRVLTVGDSARVEEYELRNTVRWKLERGDGDGTEALIAANELEARRDYTHDPNAVLATDDQASTLREQMSGDLARRILFRVQAWSPGGA